MNTCRLPGSVGAALAVAHGNDIKGDVMRSKPHMDSAMELFKCVLGIAGGKDGKHSIAIATDEFVRWHGHPSKVFLANKLASSSSLAGSVPAAPSCTSVLNGFFSGKCRYFNLQFFRVLLPHMQVVMIIVYCTRSTSSNSTTCSTSAGQPPVGGCWTLIAGGRCGKTGGLFWF